MFPTLRSDSRNACSHGHVLFLSMAALFLHRRYPPLLLLSLSASHAAGALTPVRVSLLGGRLFSSSYPPYTMRLSLFCRSGPWEVMRRRGWEEVAPAGRYRFFHGLPFFFSPPPPPSRFSIRVLQTVIIPRLKECLGDQMGHGHLPLLDQLTLLRFFPPIHRDFPPKNCQGPKTKKNLYPPTPSHKKPYP